MSDEQKHKLVFSPLCRRLSSDGMTVRVHIFRRESQADWTLEVEDQSGGSTIWRNTFESDHAALAEVMKMIEAEGFLKFLVGRSKFTVH
jgi:hypothetical protein